MVSEDWQGEFDDRGVAILTQMDPWSSSTRYRALQHVPRLRLLLRRVDVYTAGDTVRRPPGRAGQVRYFSTHAARYLLRKREVRGLVGRYDALLIQRGLYALGPDSIVNAVRRYGGRVVFDLDDAVFELSPLLVNKGRLARWLYGPQQALALLRRADEIVVSTPALAGMLPSGVPEPTILPTVPDPSRYAIARHCDRSPVVIGWAGTVGGLGYLDPLAPVFERLAREGVAAVEVVSSAPWRPWARFRRWVPEQATTLFTGFGIGIMPLPDTPYTRAKAGFKLLQYMAAGLPVIASPVGINSELVRSSGAGFLATAAGEWDEALRELAASPDLRRELGARGRAFVESYVDLDAQAKTLAQLLVGRGSSLNAGRTA